MSDNSNAARAEAGEALKYNFHRLLDFLSSPVIGDQLNKQWQKVNVGEVVRLYGIVYGTDLDLSNVIISGKKE